MKPGKELDALVAEHVMGFYVNRFLYTYIHDGKTKECTTWMIDPKRKEEPAQTRQDITINPIPYSTDIAMAWKVADKIRHFSRLYDFEIYAYGDNQFTATFTTNKEYIAHSDESAPHAICLAALNAVGYEFK